MAQSWSSPKTTPYHLLMYPDAFTTERHQHTVITSPRGLTLCKLSGTCLALESKVKSHYRLQGTERNFLELLAAGGIFLVPSCGLTWRVLLPWACRAGASAGGPVPQSWTGCGTQLRCLSWLLAERCLLSLFHKPRHILNTQVPGREMHFLVEILSLSKLKHS